MAKDILPMYTQTYIIHWFKDLAENEAILSGRGRAVAGQRRTERPISVVFAMSLLLAVSFRESDDKETSKKVRARINISKRFVSKLPTRSGLIWRRKAGQRG